MKIINIALLTFLAIGLFELTVNPHEPHYREDFAERTFCSDANARIYADTMNGKGRNNPQMLKTHKMQAFEYTDSCEKRAEELGLRPR